MGERRGIPPRRARDDAHDAGSRDRVVTPFRPRRARPTHAAAQPSGAAQPATQRGAVGVDLRAGRRAALPPIPSHPQHAAIPPTSHHATVYAPRPSRAATAPPRAATTQSRPSASQNGHRHRHSRRIALLALLCAQVLVAAGALWALTTPRFQARRIQVAGISDPLVVRRIEALPLTGCNIFRCDTTTLSQRVERLPAVGSATVSTVYPDGLLVRVTPRQPLLLWHTAAAELVVASDGTVLGAVADDPAFAHMALPEVRDGPAAAFGGATPAAGARIDPLLVNMAAQLRKGMQPVLGGGWALDYDARIGLVAVPNGGSSDLWVYFGTPRDAAQAANDTPSVAALLNTPTAGQVAQGVRMQLAELHAMLALLAGQGQQAALIDLRWGAHPYYRLAG